MKESKDWRKGFGVEENRDWKKEFGVKEDWGGGKMVERDNII